MGTIVEKAKFKKGEETENWLKKWKVMHGQFFRLMVEVQRDEI